MAAQYPQSFRLPDIEYSAAVDMGVLRTPFDSGASRQRRRYTWMPTQLQVRFVLHYQQKALWLNWWNKNAYDWFTMAVPDMTVKHATDRCEPLQVRCIADLNITPVGRDHVEITTVIELHPGWNAAAAAAPKCMWIIAGTPTAPATDTFTGGTPAAPAANTVTAGTPAKPACLI